MDADTEPLINLDHAAFMQGGVSISMGACNAGNIPSVARAAGCRVEADRRQVTIYVIATQACSLLDDVRRSGNVAVVFSQPSTYRTVQLKGSNATLGALAEPDLRIVDAYCDAFVNELRPLGYDEKMVRAIFSCAPADIVAVTFSPSAAFSQTPGPHAGEPLKANP